MGILNNKTAVITGGGSGIGLEIARTYLQEGATVVITGRNKEKLEAARNASEHNNRLFTYVADIAQEQQVANLMKFVAKTTGRIDILVNNAGAMRINKPLLDTSLEEWSSVIETNIHGTFLCSKEAAKYMVPNKKGNIINISSMSGFIVNKYFHGGSYEVSKAAFDMITKVFAVELAPHGIVVNAIAPGYYKTKPNEEFFLKNDVLRDKILDLIPRKDFGNLAELSALALFLASDVISYLTGETIKIDGGYTAW